MAKRPRGLPEFSTRPTCRLDPTMPDKPSIAGLSHTAYRLLTYSIFYCARAESDGRIPKPIMQQLAFKPGDPKELAKQGHIADQGDHWLLVDYLKWNRAKVEIDSFRAAKTERGAKGAHLRWHVPRRQFDPGCQFCQDEQETDAQTYA